MHATYLSNCKTVMMTDENMLGVMEFTPLTVKQFTTHYSASEDRIQVFLECGQSGVQALWLTRRLLNSLLSTLFAKIIGVPSGATADNITKTDAIHKFAQSAAVGKLSSNKNSLSGSKRDSNYEKYLITEIDIKRQRKVLEIIFKTEGNGKMFSIRFTDTTLRQWLSILYSRYQVAGWTETFWPTWLRAVDSNQRVAKILN